MNRMHSQVVRDLSWVVSSPSLIVDGEADSAAFDPSLVDADELNSLMASSPQRRVGFYFESLIHYWLTRLRKVELVEHGLQVHQIKRTVGEIDFLFRDEQGIFTHLETAVKFYLHLPNPTGSHFIGPNAKDNFEKKMKRLFEQQLPLSQRYFPQVTRRIGLVKGRIFYHPQETMPASLPTRLSERHQKGTWIRRDEMSWLDQQDHHHAYRVLSKPRWLSAEIARSDSSDLMNLAELKSDVRSRFDSDPRPVLVSVLEQTENHFREADRVFIVSERWPYR